MKPNKHISYKRSKQIFSTFEKVKELKIKKYLLLYSGGVDGSYFLCLSQDKQMEVIALNVNLKATSSNSPIEIADRIGIKCIVIDKVNEFVHDFLSKGIQSNAYYLMKYHPLSASFSRPLIAKTAIEFAHKNGIEMIIHTSTGEQNSANRFNVSLTTLDPSIYVFAPFLKKSPTRGTKIKYLNKYGISFEPNRYSIDENIWAREIESGPISKANTLIDPENGIFPETQNIKDTPDSPDDITIYFNKGLPYRVNNKKMNLLSIIQYLNKLGAKHGIGRFAHIEDNIRLEKRLEPREAPAAEILLKSHNEIELAVFPRNIALKKIILDICWSNLISSGYWYSDSSREIFEYIKKSNEIIEGNVELRLQKGNIFPLRRTCRNMFDFNSLNSFNHLNIDKIVKNTELLSNTVLTSFD